MKEVPKRNYSFNCLLHTSKLQCHCVEGLSSESEEFSTVHPQSFYFEDAKLQIDKYESLKRGVK